MARPPLSIQQVLSWADAHHERAGKWPLKSSGHIWEAADETWSGVNAALYGGYRNLPKGLTLARLLEKHRGVRNQSNLPRLKVEQILGWIDVFHQRTGQWPRPDSGEIPEAPGETWAAVQTALVDGRRGLPGGSSLGKLLAEHHDVRNPKQLSRLTVRQILTWADEHRQRAGKWPVHRSGHIVGTAHETWFSVDHALRGGIRGLPGGSSLAQLLARRRSVRNIQALRDLSVEQVLKWCDTHHRRLGRWPRIDDGPIPRSGGETWARINHALRNGYRGLPRMTLGRFLQTHRGVRNRNKPPRLTKTLIRAWARRHKETTGAWPTGKSGRVIGETGESWAAIDMALRDGHRGLPGGSTLSRTLRGRRPK